MLRLALWVFLAIIVVGHTAVVITNLAAVAVLPMTQPWSVSVPLVSFIVWLSTTRTVHCPLTNLENSVRRRLGLDEIHGFIGFYLVRPFRRLLGLQRVAKPHLKREARIDKDVDCQLSTG